MKNYVRQHWPILRQISLISIYGGQERASNLYGRAIATLEAANGVGSSANTDSEIWRSAVLNRAACGLEMGRWEAV
eukprot:SAG31_NODE_3936_length_3736_cov_6.504302_2_plen_76_part_00